MRLAPELAPLIARNGVLILSGLLPQQRGRVTAAYAAQGVTLLSARIFNGWSVLVLRKG